MSVADNLAKICAAIRPLIEQRLDLDEELSAMRDAVAEQGMSWVVIRAIVLAEARDDRDGGERLDKLCEKYSLANDYIALLHGHGVEPHNAAEDQAPISGLSVA